MVNLMLLFQRSCPNGITKFTRKFLQLEQFIPISTRSAITTATSVFRFYIFSRHRPSSSPNIMNVLLGSN